jgi:hypothetical protein
MNDRRKRSTWEKYLTSYSLKEANDVMWLLSSALWRDVIKEFKRIWLIIVGILDS